MGGGGEIARYLGGGDANEDIGEHVGEHAGEDLDERLDKDAGEQEGEDLDEDLDEDILCTCFWLSSRRCRCSRPFDENTISQCLQDGLSHMPSCVCRVRRAIEKKDVLQSLQWW